VQGVRIHFQSYIDPRAGGPGGGEAALRSLLATGAERGHAFVHTHLLPRAVFDRAVGIDLTLLADVWNQPTHWRRPDRALRRLAPRSGFARYRRRLRAATRGPYVHFDNAYVDICDLPYLPCDGRAEGPMCPFKSWPDRRCFAYRNRKLYDRSLLNWFVSPLHREVVLGRFGSDSPRAPSAVCRPLLDPEPFREAGRRTRARSIDTLYVGPLVEAKGYPEVVRRFGRESTTFVGASPSRRSVRAVLGSALRSGGRDRVDPRDMPALLASAKRVAALPRWPEPQGRVVLEARLAGCEVVANDRVGALTFPYDATDPRLYDGAADEFWRRVESLLPG
jgi:glycosyltransferase involved in cell wall biosynthesis